MLLPATLSQHLNLSCFLSLFTLFIHLKHVRNYTHVVRHTLPSNYNKDSGGLHDIPLEGHGFTVPSLYSSRSLVLAHLQNSSASFDQQITDHNTTFEELPDDTTLDIPPATGASRPKFVRIMTAITERSRFSDMLDVDFENASSRKWLLPYPWGTAVVDRFICKLDVAGSSDVVHQLKKQFPELSKYAIPAEVIEKRLQILDQRTDCDYFKIDMAEQAPEVHRLSPQNSPCRSHDLTRAASAKTSSEQGRVMPGPYVRPSMDGTTDPVHPDFDVIGQALGEPNLNQERTATMTSTNTFNLDAKNLPVSEDESHLLQTVQEDIHAEQDDVTIHPDTIAVKHGLAIHRDKGEAWETVKPTKQFARDRSIRRIIVEEEEARDRAVKHGLAIHRNHGESWERLENIRSSAAAIRSATEKKGKGKVRPAMKSVDLTVRLKGGMDDQENASAMPTGIKVDETVTGLSRASTIERIDSTRTVMAEADPNNKVMNAYSAAGPYDL